MVCDLGQGFMSPKLSFLRVKGVRTPAPGGRRGWGGGRANQGLGVIPGSPRCAGSGCNGYGHCSPRARRPYIRRGRGRPAPRRSLPGSGSTARRHVLRTPAPSPRPATPRAAAGLCGGLGASRGRSPSPHTAPTFSSPPPPPAPRFPRRRAAGSRPTGRWRSRRRAAGAS